MKLYNYLTEALNNPYKYYLVVRGSFGAKYEFLTDTDKLYNVYADKRPPKNISDIYKKFGIDMVIEFAFTMSGANGEEFFATGTGDAFRVFATIKQIIKDYLNKNDIEAFCFSSSSDESSRERLYDRFAKEIDKTTKYKFIEKENKYLASSSYYHFIREDLL